MSNTAIFELRTNLDKNTLHKQVTHIWENQACEGYKVEIFNFNPNKNDTLFCELLYVFGYSEEYERIREVIEYLLKIALDNQIYYYRCGDFLDLADDDDDEYTEITIDDIFTDKYEPSIGANTAEKYLIRKK